MAPSPTQQKKPKDWLEQLIADNKARELQQQRVTKSSAAQIPLADKLWPSNVQPRDGEPLGKIQQWEGDRRGRPITQAEVTKSPEFSFSTTGKSELVFDGKNLHWVGEPHGHKSYPGVSGREGYQDSKFQTLENKGPIPEGYWSVNQNRYQEIDSESGVQRFLNSVGRGNWPGDTKSWGNQRVWLNPKKGTNTMGRTDFSIHGGDVPGSAGCIDLTSCMSEFAKDFRQYGKDMDLYVFYPTSKTDKNQ